MGSDDLGIIKVYMTISVSDLEGKFVIDEGAQNC